MEDVPSFSLKGKTVVQIGGSGALGRALVTALASTEGTVVVASRNRASLDSVAASESAAGRTIVVEEVDITSEQSIQRLRDSVCRNHRRIDGLVFNAVVRPMRKVAGGLDQWTESMATNATGFFSAMRTFGDCMAEQGGGSIVNIASIYGMVGMNSWLYEGTEMSSPPDYFFHKGGMLNLTRYLASHYGPKGVRFNAVSPGGIMSPEKMQPESFRERYGKMTMLGRMAFPHEIGGAVVFLLSDAASYITGTNLPVDGGLTAK